MAYSLILSPMLTPPQAHLETLVSRPRNLDLLAKIVLQDTLVRDRRGHAPAPPQSDKKKIPRLQNLAGYLPKNKKKRRRNSRRTHCPIPIPEMYLSLLWLQKVLRQNASSMDTHPKPRNGKCSANSSASLRHHTYAKTIPEKIPI
jgi:hypothetical protein